MIAICLWDPQVFVAVLNIYYVAGSSTTSFMIIFPLLGTIYPHLCRHPDAVAVDTGKVNWGVNVALILGIQLDVIHVEKVADSQPISEFVPVATLVNDLTERVQAYRTPVWTGHLLGIYHI